MIWKIKSFDELSNIELYKILRARSEVFVVEQTCPFLDIDGKDLDCYHIFLEDSNEILAYARILPRGVAYNEASIGRVIVSINHRIHGYGRTLMTNAIDFLINELKENKIKIQAQSYLCKFYESLGFKPISDEYLEDDIPHVDMMFIKE